ncbi:MAG: CotH kinase family protein [Bacteroidetes bacterium]|nr:CotH kinase family protein [Bacteroidota bacterium]
MNIFCCVLLPVFLTSFVFAQDFYSPGAIQKIEISFEQSNWDYILDTNKQGKDGYTLAKWVKINGVQFDSAGVKYKGNSSYKPNFVKNPLHIELDYVKDQDYQGYKDIKLANGYHEPSFIREALTYSIVGKYMPASLSNFAQVYINGQYMGLYGNSEAVTKTFVDKHFFSNDYSFFFMDNVGGNLRYKGPDSSQYYFTYTIKSDYGWADLLNFCSTLKFNISAIENVLDVDRTLWMLALTNATVTLDSYIGQPSHNYYLYEDHNGRFNPIIWDLNGAFGIFNKSGVGAPLTGTQMQTLSPNLHINDTMWPLVKNVLGVPMFKRMYIAHMRTVIDENFSDSSYYYNALFHQAVIDTAFQSDPNAFYTYSEFLNNITATVVDSDGKVVIGITELMEARKNYLYSTPEFQQAPPSVTNIQPSDTFPPLDSIVYLTAQVSNAASVFCGLRYSILEKFTRIQMFDNGLNGDGAAGDGVYGVQIAATSPEIHYYIYAENNTAGIFSPQRAEYEYYTLNSDYSTVSAGEIVINEMMAVNGTTQANGLGNFNDWIELYNTTTDTILMDNLYLSDDAATPTKWQFPFGTKIFPNDYLMVWADDDILTGEHHSGFKLSGTGEQLILSYANGTVIDSISFPTQSTDVTYGRYPNGSGPFIYLTPTYDSVNMPLVSIEELNSANGYILFPNPSNDGKVQVVSLYEPISNIEVYDFTGRKIFARHAISTRKILMDVSIFGNGIYLIMVNEICTAIITVLND